MDKDQHLKFERNYLFASAAAVFTAFLCINLYPEYHGGPQIGRSGLLALSAAMIAMMIYIVRKVLTDRSRKTTNETVHPTADEDDEPVSDPARLKRMFFLWSACTILLSASLIRYPLYLYLKSNEDIGFQGIFGLIAGGSLIVATLFHVVTHIGDYKKL